MTENPIAQVKTTAWQSLAKRRIFFGHRSVGRNLIEGMECLLAKKGEPVLKIHRGRSPVSSASPGLYELDIGVNRDPSTKDEAFAKILADGFGDEPGAIAMQKYCYVDVSAMTDPVRLFEQYANHVARCRERYPGLTWVHFTIPLESASGKVEWLKSWVGATTRSSLNARRERFNDLVRERFGATEPVFDIAAIESTRANGQVSLSRFRKASIRSLATEWTNDGGHLNEVGREWVAARFLAFLAAV